jgi:hypothetical protein
VCRNTSIESPRDFAFLECNAKSLSRADTVAEILYLLENVKSKSARSRFTVAWDIKFEDDLIDSRYILYILSVIGWLACS